MLKSGLSALSQRCMQRELQQSELRGLEFPVIRGPVRPARVCTCLYVFTCIYMCLHVFATARTGKSFAWPGRCLSVPLP